MNCPICNEPVSLETSKTDEDGQAIHEECYASKVCTKSGLAYKNELAYKKKTGTSG